ncbi:hypothetical protein MLD38_011703 [Melastoma candidum]|uniref:Uncharacterized protein n=1 Tax=Melastoma candidum TaxID=119954 RepID=A0ACB9R590_9MYRT|nr:hypothetical protein MLD38_011703 [Melastoma candidum]
MPRAKANASSAARPVEPEKPAEFDERVDLEEDPEELEEEVEYEEVEEEEEIEEIEEEEEDEEVEVEEEVEIEEEEDNDVDANGADGQRAIGGPDPMTDDEEEKKTHAELLARPPHGSEVYIGGIPHDAQEEELKTFCESIGEVVEVRIMKAKDSNENKGFAFVTFKNVELATEAMEKLNESEFKGKKVKCSTSQAKHRLFIGNIPRSWGDEDLRQAVSRVGPGVTGIELVKDMNNPSNNRGFAFIEYYNHACAEYSRQKMMNPSFKLDTNAPTISWADPKNADSASAQVKAVYVKNLPKDVTQDQLKKLFEHHGRITKVVLPPARPGQEKNRIGFVHFAERSSAMKALKNTEKYELDGQVVECSLAKPQVDQKSAVGSVAQMGSLLPNYPLPLGYGLAGGAYGGALGTGFGAASFAQPMIYGRGLTPAGMAMMPMLLPDGRIGYVLQQPGMQPLSSPPPQRGGSVNGRGGGGIGSASGIVRVVGAFWMGCFELVTEVFASANRWLCCPSGALRGGLRNGSPLATVIPSFHLPMRSYEVKNRTKTEDLQALRLITAVKTPYLPDGRFDLEAYDDSHNLQIVQGVEAVVVGGTSGEGHLMSWDELIMLIGHTVNCFGGSIEVIGNVGRNLTREEIHATEQGFAVGMHAALHINPYYGKNLHKRHDFPLRERPTDGSNYPVQRAITNRPGHSSECGPNPGRKS